MSTDIRDAVARALHESVWEDRSCLGDACFVGSLSCVCVGKLADAALAVARPLIEAEARERALREAIEIVIDEDGEDWGWHVLERLRVLLPAHAQEPAPADDWIPWGGGECPVYAGAHVFVMFRTGEHADDSAGTFEWQHGLGFADIVAYRIVKEPAHGTR